jgi:methionyl-tRNA formyltransferase
VLRGGSIVRVAFLGLPLAALLLGRDGHDVVVAAVCRRGAPGIRRLRARLGDDRVLVKPDVSSRAFARRVRDAKPDVLVSWFWTSKIPTELVAMAPLGGFGVHPSLLPRWRGPDPCFWAIDAGDPVTGVTAHRIADEYDTGAMLGKRELAIQPTWDSWQLARALDRPSLELLRELVATLARGEALVEQEQDEALASEAPAPSDDLLEIEWSRPAEAIVRRVRAAAPFPGAWTFIGDDAVVITRAEVADAPRGLLPGEGRVVVGRAVIAAGEGGVALLAGRIVGEDDVERDADEGALAEALLRAGPPEALSE